MIDERMQQYKNEVYSGLEKGFVSYADLTTVTERDMDSDLEPFVTLASYGNGLIGRYVVRHDIENLQNQNIIVRESVYKKLKNVDMAIKNRNENWQLVVVYGYRSLDVQHQLFNMEKAKVKSKNAELSDAEINEIVHRRIAVPAVAGHPTGGTVDVTIYDYGNDCYLDFGTEVRDFSTKDVYVKSPYISKEQKDNRSYLRKVMTAEGFVPYDGEWWHFSYGDKEWAFFMYRQAQRSKSNMSNVEMRYLYEQKSPSELVFADKYRASAKIEQKGSIRLAVQKNGRLTDDTINILNKSGIDVTYDEGRFFGKSNNFPLEILFVRDDDIPDLVDAGVADIGIVGENMYAEADCKSIILKKLGFGRCALAVAVPESSVIRSIFDLSGKRVATSYRRSTEKFFLKEKIANVTIVPISGSVEMAPTIGYADAIVDLVSTGSSLRQNKLEFLHKIFDSESILITNRASYDLQDKHATIERFVGRINIYLSAKSYKHIMFSVSAEQIESVKTILSSAKLLSTSSALDKSDSCIVRAVIKKASIWDVAERIQKSGATDFVFYDIEGIM